MITVENLTRYFTTGGKTLVAVDGLSFSVRAGEVYGLLGPNGAGKTTTLRMILGLLHPTSGDATVDGFPVSQFPDEVKRRIGLVSASAGLYQWLTPREMLLFFADLYGVGQSVARDRLESLADLLDLQRFLDQRCSTLSTGQKQRVTLARALMHDPPIMLLDEPTRGLDVVGTHVIFEYIGHLRTLGKAVVVSTHRLDEASQICDRMGLLHRGTLRYEGTFAELQRATGCATLFEMFLQLIDKNPINSSSATSSASSLRSSLPDIINQRPINSSSVTQGDLDEH
jgi:ABC-2 type transport system ATP-binding protein/sodium transport system ATP-binding protein